MQHDPAAEPFAEPIAETLEMAGVARVDGAACPDLDCDTPPGGPLQHDVDLGTVALAPVPDDDAARRPAYESKELGRREGLMQGAEHLVTDVTGVLLADTLVV